MRLFVALPLPDDVRADLARLAHGLRGATWIAEQNLHLTLRFIGECSREEAHDIDAMLSGVRVSAFEMTLGEIGTFSTGGKVRAVWVGAQPVDQLRFLRDRVESALGRCGLKPESRSYKPHVSLARLKSPPGSSLPAYLAAHSLFRSRPIQVDSFTLFRSYLSHSGSIYEPIAEYDLQAI